MSVTASTAALHHKLIASAAGREGDAHADARDEARAHGHESLAREFDVLAAAAYAREAFHLSQREATGAHLGGPQPSKSLAGRYAARFAA